MHYQKLFHATKPIMISSYKKNEKTMKQVLIFCMILLALGCKKLELTGIKNNSNMKEIKLPSGSDKIIKATSDFGIDIFKRIVNDESVDANIFVSPTSISLALSMTLNGAVGSTKDSMIYALRLPNYSIDEINSINQQLMQGLTTADDKVIMTIANSIWYRQGFDVKTDFIQVNTKYYDAEVEALDFSQSNAKDVINGWVENKTNGKIKDLIENISPADVMFLIDAIYFKGTWTIAFAKNSTEDEQFTLNDGSQKTVQMMNMKDSLAYFENDLSQAVQLDYGRGNFSMVVFLPKANHTTGDIVSSMNYDNWQSWMNSFRFQTVGLKMPKFSFDYYKNLNDVLIGMGMGIAFSDAADFTGITPGGGIAISYVKQKSFLEVDEEGTEAAAATVVAVISTANPVEQPDQTKYMTVDHPFIFAIREKSTNSIVFLGKVSDPEYQE